MLALDLLTSHLFGDYVFQIGPIPARKLTDWRIRLFHVAIYTVCFVPSALIETRDLSHVLLFLAALAVCHFITDSRRFGSGATWAPRPIMVDQSLHVAQLAVLSRILTGAAHGTLLAVLSVVVMSSLYVTYGLYERHWPIAEAR